MSTPFGRRTGVAILAALCAVGAPLLATAPGAAAHQDRWRDVDGNNVTRVRYNGGAFAESAPGQWTEFNADGRPIHSFDETRRDAFTVMLTDRSRNATVVLDLRSREIRGGGAFRPLRTLYAITGAEARGRGWDRGRDDGRRDGPRRDDRGGWDRGGGGARATWRPGRSGTRPMPSASAAPRPPSCAANGPASGTPPWSGGCRCARSASAERRCSRRAIARV